MSGSFPGGVSDLKSKVISIISTSGNLSGAAVFGVRGKVYAGWTGTRSILAAHLCGAMVAMYTRRC